MVCICSNLLQVQYYFYCTNNSVYRYGIICISESFLDLTISDDGNILHMEGLIRKYHPDNIKRGGVCLYFKKSLALRKIELSHITECLLCEVNVKGQVGFIIVSYRSPSQTTSQFDDFLSNFEKLFDNVHILQPAFTVILGDFNAQSKSWWYGDSTTVEGTRLDSLVSTHGFNQLISEPTHILQNLLSCIDLIFTDQPSLVVDSGVHPTLHENCHHQITYYKLNLKIVYPLPYECLVWDIKRADM